MLRLKVCLKRHYDPRARRKHAFHEQRAVERLEAEWPPVLARLDHCYK